MTDRKIEIIRSPRKTLALQITRELRIIVRAPLYMREEEIIRFITEKAPWIEKHLDKMAQRTTDRPAAPPLTKAQLQTLRNTAKKKFAERTAHFARELGTSYGRITIRQQTSRWGSCSAKGNLNFNCLLLLCPPEVQDYVIIHELCHLREMNHSAAFWALVACACPDYAQHRRWLKENGGKLMERLEKQ